jgi:Animal haem peroxidase
MSNSQVPRIELNKDGSLNIEVNVYGFDGGTPVELSGHATQTNGAVASFYQVQTTPAHDGETVALWVKSIAAVPPNKFVTGFPVTVVVRATEAWITILDKDTDSGATSEIAGSGALSGAWKSSNFGWAVTPSPSKSSPATPASPPAGPPDAQLRHGTWWDRVKREPLDAVMAGRFTRLFPDLRGARFDRHDLELLAAEMTAPPEAGPVQQAGRDPEENPGMPAAYTYLGQFIDHDLTFDPSSNLRERLTRSQLQALMDFRTPRFDLDNLYGRGPDDQPYLYEKDGVRLLPGEPMAGNPFDPGAVQLPRGPNGRALIGDPRNDENRIVAQLHAIFLRFHNRVVEQLGGPRNVSFSQARRQVQWHYQWIVVRDFLPTILQEQTYKSVFPDSYPSPAVPILRENNLALMPVEFSVAAYRFGHSMVRPRYRLNQTIERPIFSGTLGDNADLGGFRPIPANWAIDWRFFIDLDHAAGPVTPQLSYKIDTSLVNPLGSLPPQIATHPSSLALRNLERGATFQLPSGQQVAEALGIPPIADEDLVIGKATADSLKRPMEEIAPVFAGNAPLWAYVLSEAQVSSWDADHELAKDDIPIRLGPVGGQLVGEVFASLLRGDLSSYLYAQPAFKPIADFTRGGTFGLAELINVALGRMP